MEGPGRCILVGLTAWAAVGSAAAFPGMAACRVPARWTIRGRCPTPARIIQIEDTGGIRMVLAGFPLLALGAVTGNQFRHQDDGRRTACTCGRREQRHGIQKALSAADADVSAITTVRENCAKRFHGNVTGITTRRQSDRRLVGGERV
jgi:hypothetical protein